ncbi:UTP--glucose-1-phosphate uridylyltransferase [Pullulanibacillus pueri]|uniref:UTP--glucose-1-phosphate uridylyltransferase n=1 Tax=Pullulanibacillus pueri TaxID=1437324 RepID=A0A8J2ZV60_9BACL|nr:sugar phosphate nucleotidyltransferase [Pullulanibacillus pueri]MBM7682350.1 UTP--glucose-1-phosphate uridylyltransferase [Pullulanibacillus pueri]GGH80698.1 UTP--glucose-1-phosphate uridylyltransferase [Pullulanibacillus pueri]
MTIKKAVILAAGRGSRMGAMTKVIPKPLLPLVDRPILDHIIEEARTSGIEDIFIVVHFQHHLIESYYAQEKDIHFIYQPSLNGTGPAVLLAKDFIEKEAFALFLADEVIISQQPCIQQLMQVYEQVPASLVTGVEETTHEKIKKYNALRIEAYGESLVQIHEMIEKPQHPVSPYTSIGRYILSNDLLALLAEDIFEETNSEIPLTSYLNRLAQAGKAFGLLFEGKRLDLGSVNSWWEGNYQLKLYKDDRS